MEKLATYMKAHGLSRADMAARSGVGESQLSRYIRGERVPSLQNALAIAAATNGAVAPQDWAIVRETAARDNRDDDLAARIPPGVL